VLDVYAPSRAAVVGHSMGGAHAIQLAAKHPERVSHLVIVDSSAEPLPEGAERARRLSLERPDRFAHLKEAMEYVRRTSPGYSEPVYENRARWLFRKTIDGTIWRSSAASLRAILDDTGRHGDMWQSLATIRCPTLIVRGTRSNVLSAEVARRMVAALRDGRMLELDAGHNVPLDRPNELADAVVALARGSA
jgi:pimeloyl-ACP methyl ester carboxylesterase